MKLLINNNFKADNDTNKLAKMGTLVTPSAGEKNFWLFKVQLTKKQAIIGFPKFTTVDIGFEVEEDWDVNLPYNYKTSEIYHHIKHNKGKDNKISPQSIKKAIKLIQGAAKKFRGE